MSFKFKKVIIFLKKSIEGVKKFFIGRLLASLIIGICVFAVMKLLDSPLPWLIGLLTGIGNVVPTIGPIITYIISAIILLFMDPVQALYLLLVIIATQILDGLVLSPLISGKSAGMKPLIVIIITMMGGGLFGIPGVLLAVPVAIIVRVFYGVFIKKSDNQTKN